MTHMMGLSHSGIQKPVALHFGEGEGGTQRQKAPEPKAAEPGIIGGGPPDLAKKALKPRLPKANRGEQNAADPTLGIEPEAPPRDSPCGCGVDQILPADTVRGKLSSLFHGAKEKLGMTFGAPGGMPPAVSRILRPETHHDASPPLKSLDLNG